MGNFLDDLKKYYAETPREIILKEWEECSQANNNVGPSVKHFMAYTKYCIESQGTKAFLQFEQSEVYHAPKEQFENPKNNFSGFFINTIYHYEPSKNSCI